MTCTAVIRKKLQFLKRNGYNIVEVWECQWQQMKNEREEIKTFVDQLAIVEPLNPRDAFCGGRTNAAKLYHHVEEGEEIDYYDYISLYPYVNKNGEYSLGHPVIIYQPGHADISRYFDIAQCTALPPYEFYYPVLPFRHNDKLTFPLCRSCVEEEMAKQMLERSCVCNHIDKQRQILGAWCTPELEKEVKNVIKFSTLTKFGTDRFVCQLRQHLIED